jgi:hypothetical protein
MARFPEHDADEGDPCPKCNVEGQVKEIYSDSGQTWFFGHGYDFNRYCCGACGYIFEKRWYE